MSNRVDRDAATRTVPDLCATLLGKPGTRIVLADARGRVALDGASVAGDLPTDGLTPAASPTNQLRLAPLRAGDLDTTTRASLGAEASALFYLGTTPQTEGEESREAWVGVVLPDHSLTPPTDAEGAGVSDPYRDLREHYPMSALRGVGANLSDTERALATEAVALAAWHARSRYCTLCGGRTQATQAGWAQECERCGQVLFPRHDPAVIMAVTDEEDRLLLVHGASWADGRYSVVAGFVEAGESAEEAVAREVWEETGLRVGSVEYVTTQPWPFPRSFMLGYRARLLPGQRLPRPDGEEVTGAMLVSREELRERVARGSVTLPGPASVARVLIEDWYGESASSALG